MAPDKLLMAQNHMERGIALRKSGNYSAAVDSHRRALETVGGPIDTREMHLAALILENLGNALQDAGDSEAGLEAVERSIELWEHLIQSGEPRWSNLAFSYQHRMNRCLSIGAYDEGVAGGAKAVKLFKDLVSEGRDDLLEQLARSQAAYSLALERSFDLPGALAALEESISVFKSAPRIDEGAREVVLSGLGTRRGSLLSLVSATQDKVPAILVNVAHGARQGAYLVSQGMAPQARTFLEDALGWLMWVIRIDDGAGVQHMRGNVCISLGSVGLVLGIPRVAHRAFRFAVLSFGALVQTGGHREFGESLAKSYLGLATAYATTGDDREAGVILDAMNSALTGMDEGVRESWLERAGAQVSEALSLYDRG